jgi:hypothetical protein
MRHARIGIYEFKPNTVDAIIEKARNGLWPLLRQQPGFVSYQLARTDASKLVSFSVYDTRVAAENAARVMADWVKKNVASDVVSSQYHVAELSIDSASAGEQPQMHP